MNIDFYYHLKAGFLMFKRKKTCDFDNKEFSVNKQDNIKKSKEEIQKNLEKIIEQNFNGYYFTPGLGHFKDFYIRDFGWVVESLLNLGYKKEVEYTLDFVLSMYMKHKRITTCVGKNYVYDFPKYSVDSLAYLLYSIDVSNYKLNQKQIHFLNKEIIKFYKYITKEGLVNPKKHFSSLADHKVRKSSTYDNSMHYLFCKSIQNLQKKKYELRLYFKPKEISNLIEKNFWNKNIYYDDLDKKDYISADSQIFPFITGACKDYSRFKKIIKLINDKKLNYPISMSYHETKLFQDYSLKKHIKNIFKNPKNMPRYHIESIASYRYETDTLWTLLGINYLKTIDVAYHKTKDKLFLKEMKKELGKYKKSIKNFGTLYEVFQRDKNSSNKYSPYKSKFYFSEEGMIWGAVILDIMLKYN